MHFKDTQIKTALSKHNFTHFKRAVGRFFNKNAERVSFGKRGMCEDYIVYKSVHIEVFFMEQIEIDKHQRKWIDYCNREGIKYIMVSEENSLLSQLDNMK